MRTYVNNRYTNSHTFCSRFLYRFSAGAGGCPLAQTMAENGLKVLLLERGGEQVYNSQQLMTSIKALTDDCAESIRSIPGHTVTTGNCMGGTSLLSHISCRRGDHLTF